MTQCGGWTTAFSHWNFVVLALPGPATSFFATKTSSLPYTSRCWQNHKTIFHYPKKLKACAPDREHLFCRTTNNTGSVPTQSGIIDCLQGAKAHTGCDPGKVDSGGILFLGCNFTSPQRGVEGVSAWGQRGLKRHGLFQGVASPKRQTGAQKEVKTVLETLWLLVTVTSDDVANTMFFRPRRGGRLFLRQRTRPKAGRKLRKTSFVRSKNVCIKQQLREEKMFEHKKAKILFDTNYHRNLPKNKWTQKRPKLNLLKTCKFAARPNCWISTNKNAM